MVSGTRLKAVVFKSADGAIAPLGSGSGSLSLFWDSLLETYCVPGFDGVCTPIESSSVGYFSDAACTQRLLQNASSPLLQGLPTAKVVHSPVAVDGGAAPKFFRVGAAFTGPVYTLYIGRCSSMQFGTGPFFQAGAEVPLSDFATFQVAIDP